MFLFNLLQVYSLHCVIFLQIMGVIHAIISLLYNVLLKRKVVNVFYPFVEIILDSPISFS